MVGVGANFAFRGYWNAINRSALYMRTIILMHVANIFFNWVFIFGNLGAPELGAQGAGVATAIATYIATAYYFYLGVRHSSEHGFLKQLPSTKSLIDMLRLAGPTGVQRFFFAAGMTVFFWIVGLVGRAELAASNVLVNLMLVGILPGIGFGMAGASLVGQALGRNEPEDAKQWGYDVAKLTMLVVGIIGIVGLIVPDLLLGIFITNSDTVALARTPLRILAGFLFLDTAGLVFLSTLQGAGDTRRTMVISVVLQWAFLLPLAYVVGKWMGYGLIGIWGVQMFFRLLQAAIFAWLWKDGKWATIKV
jgi:putative MATE family efflux protein